MIRLHSTSSLERQCTLRWLFSLNYDTARPEQHSVTNPIHSEQHALLRFDLLDNELLQLSLKTNFSHTKRIVIITRTQ